MPESIYLDWAASAPMCTEAIAAWNRAAAVVGNPSGGHQAARRARSLVDDTRDRLGALCGVNPSGVIFTSGGTEADNLAVLGLGDPHRRLVVVSAIEHHAVLEAARRLNHLRVPVDSEGLVDPGSLREALIEHQGEVRLVSIMAVNNEVGVIQPVRELVDIVREIDSEVVVHCDAVQALGCCDLAVLGVDALTVSAHKVGGPQGVGALVTNGRGALRPLVVGGGQEAERRAGTHNVAGIAAFGAALERLSSGRDERLLSAWELRRSFVSALTREVPAFALTVAHECVAPHIVHGSIGLAPAEAVLMLMDQAGVCGSAAASCSSGAATMSHVLAALGRSPEENFLRLSFGAGTTTEDELARAAVIIGDCVRRLTR